MANKIGPMIKEARTAAKMTQEELAKSIPDLSASDLSKAERGEKELPAAILKQIAKATGVTQKSLLEAAAESTYKTAASKKTTSSTGAKTASSKTSGSSGAKKTGAAASGTTITVTTAEKKLIELYRAADSETKKNAVKLLKGEELESGGDLLSSLIAGAIDMLSKK